MEYDYFINFGSVAVGRTIRQKTSVEITKNDKEVIVKRHCAFPYSIAPFHLNKRYGSSRMDLEIVVEYRPFVAGLSHACYYEIIDGASSKVLFVKGATKGTVINASVKRLKFHVLKDSKVTRRKFELTNCGNVVAFYQFDIDNNTTAFRVDPLQGEILPGRHQYVTVDFTARNQGEYRLYLVCNILYHKPIFVELCAVRCEKLDLIHHEATLRTRELLPNLDDVEDNVILRISEEALDFGSTHNKNYKSLLYTTLTNVCDENIKIEWSAVENFKIQPESACMVTGERRHFAVEFCATREDKLYMSRMYGRATPLQDTPRLGTTLHLDLLGSTFPEGGGFAAQVRAEPKCITLPISAPGGCTRATLLVRNDGMFPSALCCHTSTANEQSVFKVHPGVAVIQAKQALLLTVRFRAVAYEASFNELWELRVSGGARLALKFRSSVQKPAVRVCTADVIEFPPLYPGCVGRSTIPIYNLTQHRLRCRLSVGQQPWVRAEVTSFELDPLDKVETTWTAAAQLDMPYEHSVTLFLSIITYDGCEQGSPYEHHVTVHTTSVYTRICALPRSLDLGNVVCNSKYETEVTLHNFGGCNLYYRLVDEPPSDESGLYIAVDPREAMVVAGGKRALRVKVEPQEPGMHLAHLNYQVCQQFDPRPENEIVNNLECAWQDGGPALSVQCIASYPHLRVVDLTHNCGELFGRARLWEILSVDALNTALATAKPNVPKYLPLCCPEFEVGIGDTKSVTLVLRNTSDIDATFSVERLPPNCQCDPEPDCPHNRALRLNAYPQTIPPGYECQLTMYFSYTVPGPTILHFRLFLSHGRYIELALKMVALQALVDNTDVPLIYPLLSAYISNWQWCLRDVWIGEREPPLQSFWLYNNGREAVRYTLLETPLERLNARHGTVVLSAPVTSATIQASNAQAFLLRFRPVVTGQITIRLPLLLNQYPHDALVQVLTVTARGLPQPIPPQLLTEEPRIDIHPNHRYLEELVLMSVPSVHVRHMQTHGTATRLVFLRNNSHTQRIAFCTGEAEVPHVMFLRTQPRRGLLAPGQIVPLAVQFAGLSQPGIARLQLGCYLLDYTKLQEHIRTKTEHNQQVLSHQQNFCVTDGGEVSYPPATKRISEAPKVVHRSLAVDVEVIAQTELDRQVPLRDQLRFWPGKELATDEQSPAACPTEPAVRVALECVVRDVVWSRAFYHRLTSLQNTATPYYAQLREGCAYDELRQRMTLPISVAANVLDCLLQDCLFRELDLVVSRVSYELEQLAAAGRSSEHETHLFRDTYPKKFMFLMTGDHQSIK